MLPVEPCTERVVDSNRSHLVAALVSLLLHLVVLGPSFVSFAFEPDFESAGTEDGAEVFASSGGGELAPLTEPVQVAIYKEPAKAAPVTSTAPTTPVAEAPAASTESSSGEGTSRKTSSVSSNRGSKESTGSARSEGSGKPPRGKKKPCDKLDEITQLSDTSWRVERDLLDWYATHLRELDKLAGVVTHKDDDGKPDGARLWLPRCSYLKQGGFKHGDIVRSVNGREVYTIPQGVKAWIAERKAKKLTVVLTRRNGEERTHTIHLK